MPIEWHLELNSSVTQHRTYRQSKGVKTALTPIHFQHTPSYWHHLRNSSTLPPLPFNHPHPWSCPNRSYAYTTSSCSYPYAETSHSLIKYVLCYLFPPISWFVALPNLSYSHRVEFILRAYWGAQLSQVDTNWDSSVPQAASIKGQGKGTCVALIGFYLDAQLDYILVMPLLFHLWPQSMCNIGWYSFSTIN